MRVEVWIRNDMMRFKGTTIDDYDRVLRFIYEDTVSSSPKQAAERLWNVTNNIREKLDVDDLKLKEDWDRQMMGFSFGVGDAISSGGQVIECVRGGQFIRGETPSGRKQIGIPSQK